MRGNSPAKCGFLATANRCLLMQACNARTIHRVGSAATARCDCGHYATCSKAGGQCRCRPGPCQNRQAFEPLLNSADEVDEKGQGRLMEEHDLAGRSGRFVQEVGSINHLGRSCFVGQDNTAAIHRVASPSYDRSVDSDFLRSCAANAAATDAAVLQYYRLISQQFCLFRIMRD